MSKEGFSEMPVNASAEANESMSRNMRSAEVNEASLGLNTPGAIDALREAIRTAQYRTPSQKENDLGQL